MLGAGADTGAPKPGNDDVAPPNKGLGGATSFFSDSCSADEGVRVNGSEVVEGGCKDGANVGRVGGARDGP